MKVSSGRPGAAGRHWHKPLLKPETLLGALVKQQGHNRRDSAHAYTHTARQALVHVADILLIWKLP
jgi:hypothetical protein